MRIAVMGTGGVGGYFGARLAAAGQEVGFIARGAHLDAIRAGALRVVSPAGDLHLTGVKATDDPADIGPVDVVLFAVKLWDTEAAAPACRPLVGPDTAVITLQNGVDSLEVLGRVLGHRHAAGGVAHISATIAEPGVIRHYGPLARITFGEPDGSSSPRLLALHAAGVRAGFEAVLAPDIRVAIWEKFLFLAPLSGLTALTRLPVGPIRGHADSRALIVEAVAEVAAVARARGVALPEDAAARTLAFFDSRPDGLRASMLTDLERGHRLELPWLSGAVARMGRELGVPTPVHRVIAAALAPYVMGATR